MQNEFYYFRSRQTRAILTAFDIPDLVFDMKQCKFHDSKSPKRGSTEFYKQTKVWKDIYELTILHLQHIHVLESASSAEFAQGVHKRLRWFFPN